MEGYPVKIAIVGGSGHYRYVLQELKNHTLLGIAPGIIGEELTKLKNALTKAEIAAQRRINELLSNIRTQADADAAAQELQQLRAAFSTGTQADIVALFILECYPEAVPMVYAYEDLKLKLKEANYHGSSALKSQLK